VQLLHRLRVFELPKLPLEQRKIRKPVRRNEIQQ
jgi:hypothetical protein